MKNEILNYFKSDRSFEGAVILYNKYGQNLTIKKRFNTEGDNPVFVGILHDELRKLAGLSLVQFQNIMMLKRVIYRHAVPVEEPTAKSQELIAINEIPVHIKKIIRLREHFPFLKAKDCPKEAKILVNDMISAYERFRDEHAKLFEVNSEQEIIKVCEDVLEPYLENRQIWDELESFKASGEFLRKHPIFELQEAFEELKKMSAKELSKRKETLINGINRNKKDIEKNEKPNLIDGWKIALEKRELELAEVNRLLEQK